jgi:hypothetical protein
MGIPSQHWHWARRDPVVPALLKMCPEIEADEARRIAPNHSRERDAHWHGGGVSPSPRGPSPGGRGADLARDYRAFPHPSPSGRGVGGEEYLLLRGTGHRLAATGRHPLDPQPRMPISGHILTPRNEDGNPRGFPSRLSKWCAPSSANRRRRGERARAPRSRSALAHRARDG